MGQKGGGSTPLTCFRYSTQVEGAENPDLVQYREVGESDHAQPTNVLLMQRLVESTGGLPLAVSKPLMLDVAESVRTSVSYVSDTAAPSDAEHGMAQIDVDPVSG